MLRKILLAGACLAAMSASASAADMAVKAAPVPYLYNWTGLYVGLNAGYGWGRFSDDFGARTDVNGFVGGGQIGYNWQTGHLVFGLETDFQGSDQKDSATGLIFGVPFTATARIRYFGTVRGRLGYAQDRWLGYITGGFAYVNGGIDVTALGLTVSDNTTKGGGTIGAGFEYAFNGPWTAGIEYLYIDTGSRSVTLLGVTDNVRTRDNVVRAKINYRF